MLNMIFKDYTYTLVIGLVVKASYDLILFAFNQTIKKKSKGNPKEEMTSS